MLTSEVIAGQDKNFFFFFFPLNVPDKKVVILCFG